MKARIGMISNLFGSKLSTWVKAYKLFCLRNIITIIVHERLFRKSSVFGTWKIDALFKI